MRNVIARKCELQAKKKPALLAPADDFARLLQRKMRGTTYFMSRE